MMNLYTLQNFAVKSSAVDAQIPDGGPSRGEGAGANENMLQHSRAFYKCPALGYPRLACYFFIT